MIKEELPDLSWLEAYRTDSPNFGLERMERMLALRGNPHLQLSVIHIGGDQRERLDHFPPASTLGNARPACRNLYLPLFDQLQ